MKAKEYAKIAIDGNYDLDSVSEIVKGLMCEISGIARARNVGTLPGMNAVIQEIRQKWVAICRRAEGLNKDGFDKFLVDKGLINKDHTLNVHYNACRPLPREKIMGA